MNEMDWRVEGEVNLVFFTYARYIAFTAGSSSSRPRTS